MVWLIGVQPVRLHFTEADLANGRDRLSRGVREGPVPNDAGSGLLASFSSETPELERVVTEGPHARHGMVHESVGVGGQVQRV